MDRMHIRQMMIAVNEIDGACALISKKIGMKENTLTLLYALDDGRAHSQKEICEEWFLPKTTLNTIVKECVEAGYLTLDGGREKEIRLTEKGKAYAGKALPQVYELETRASGGLSPELAEELCQFARRLKEEARNFTYGA